MWNLLFIANVASCAWDVDRGSWAWAVVAAFCALACLREMDRA